MSKRVTIMIGDAVDAKVRKKQAQLITKTNSTVSYSSVINSVLNNEFKL